MAALHLKDAGAKKPTTEIDVSTNTTAKTTQTATTTVISSLIAILNGHAVTGKCITIPGATALPLKQCFCEAGKFGLNCENDSDLSDNDFNEDDYEESVSMSKVSMFWKDAKGGQIEVAARFEGTTSWVALGFRYGNSFYLSIIIPLSDHLP